jgi:hypothetical protein
LPEVLLSILGVLLPLLTLLLLLLPLLLGADSSTAAPCPLLAFVPLLAV